MNIDIAKLMREAKNDPELLSHINISELLKSIDSVKNDFLETHTFESISAELFESIVQLPIDKKTAENHCDKLVGYRFVDELHLLHKGKYIRWIRHDAPHKLMKGAVVVDIQFCDFGANILCRLMTGHFLRYRFDKCNTYQKLTDEEQLILMLYDKNSI
jgi:hypothetical protein